MLKTIKMTSVTDKFIFPQYSYSSAATETGSQFCVYYFPTRFLTHVLLEFYSEITIMIAFVFLFYFNFVLYMSCIWIKLQSFQTHQNLEHVSEFTSDDKFKKRKRLDYDNVWYMYVYALFESPGDWPDCQRCSWWSRKWSLGKDQALLLGTIPYVGWDQDPNVLQPSDFWTRNQA